MGSRTVITEETVIAARNRGEKQLSIPEGSLITPLARDTAKRAGIAIVSAAALPTGDVSKQADRPRVVAVGCDHGGYEYKREIVKFLDGLGWQVLDVGTNSNARCDYPDFAFAVARSVSSGKAGVGIMIDGAGPGSAIVANKVPGIRAACAHVEFAAWNSRAHNDCNVLTLGSRVTGLEVCKRIVEVFLSTNFEGGRHQQRVDKIRDLESHFSARSDLP